MMLTVKDVSERLQISVSMTYKLVQRGELPSYQIGTARRVHERDLEMFLEERKVDHTPLPPSKSVHF